MAFRALRDLPRVWQGTAKVVACCLFLAFVSLWHALAAAAETPSSLKGRLLIAAADMVDPNFGRTVVYMIEHDASGAMGLVVNRSMGSVSADHLLENLGITSEDAKGEIAVHQGGPVEPGAGFVLHSADFLLEDSLSLRDKMALTTNPEILRAIAEGKGPERYLFALGYAGWGPGQLESEIARGSWHDIETDNDLVFGPEGDQSKWDQAMARRAIEL